MANKLQIDQYPWDSFDQRNNAIEFLSAHY
jgi:hypothetical protein